MKRTVLLPMSIALSVALSVARSVARSVALSVALSAALPVAAVAQTRAPERGTWLLTAELGGAAFTDFQRVRATAAPAIDGGTPVERRVSAGTTATVGMRLGYWAGRNWGMRAGAAYSPSTFTVSHDDAAEQLIVNEGSDEVESYASLSVWNGDIALLFRFPRGIGRVQPYGIIGGGAIRYTRGRDAELPPEARESFAAGEQTRAAGLFGVGALIPLQQRDILLSFELTNHLSRSPLADADNGSAFEVSGILMEPAPLQQRQDDDSPSITNHLRLVVGLTLPLR